MISVIIPTLNEKERLVAVLSRLRASGVAHEVIVADGGSEDGTTALARSLGARVLVSPRLQRAAQMNLGSREAQGEALLFLHADTLLPDVALERIEKVLRRPEVVGGAFARRFDGGSLFLRLTCWLAEIRSRISGWFLGDQAIFVRRHAFEKLGGFRDLDLFEDLDFSRRMRRVGRVVTLKPPVVSSGRRFRQRGAVATTWSDLVLTARYLRGEDPNRLAAQMRCSKQALSDLKISIIIPTLNEEASLPRLLPDLIRDGDEIWVVDGGSTDATLEVARHFPVKVLKSRPGRAAQMNAGAAASTGDLLWFLHADTVIPLDWRDQLLKAAADPGLVGGGFRVRIDAAGFRYRFLDAWGRWRSRVQRSFYGDQGIFVRRKVFETLKGFTDLPVLEDLDFSARLSCCGKTVMLPGPLKTSARQWQSEGWWKTVRTHSGLALSYALCPAARVPVRVIIVAKAPQPGKVKTRLTPPLTPEQAAAVAQRLLQETAAKVHHLEDVQQVLAVSPANALDEVGGLLDFQIRLVPQPEGDLGQRLARLFDWAFAEGARGVAILGVDHPGLPEAYLRKAVALLQQGKDRLVLGPTEDGGYYLVGLTRPHPELFEGIPWSTSEVFEKTCEKAAALGLPVSRIPSWFDLDRPEDLARLPKVWGLPGKPLLR